jgi:uncharacterized membrane protein YqaE (UPF0057 family)
MPFTGSDIIKIIFAIFIPPLGVFLERGCNADFLINILLTILGYIPGEFQSPLSAHRPTQTDIARHNPRLVHYPQVLVA